jgi:hypothetical protein
MARRLADLRQREDALRETVSGPSLPALTTDPVTLFDRRVAVDAPTAAVVERLARLASDVRARDLFIETVEGATPSGAVVAPLAGTYGPDPRFALFERQVAYTTIRMSFDADYAGVGRFLWSVRDLPTIVEIRALNLQPRMPGAGDGGSGRDGTVRASLTLFAYSRSASTATAVTR